MKTGSKGKMKKGVDVCMTVVLLLLMAYQVTGEALHEWCGIAETVLVVIHQILNRKWYGALFKGKYNPYRSVTTAINVLLIASFLLTAFCGMSMSGYAVPFLYGMAPVSFVRRMHLSMSHWAFVLMGAHLGLHIPAMLSRFKLSEKVRTIATVIFALAGGYGLYLFLRNGMPDYLFFKVPFAFLDYEKAAVFVILENILMLIFWAFIGTQLANICRNGSRRKKESDAKRNTLLPIMFMMAAVLIGMGVYIASGHAGSSKPVADWGAPAETVTENKQKQETTETEPTQKTQIDLSAVDDGFVLLDGGTFLMGSPESENWRVDDETQHEVSVASFYIDPYETTQEDYQRLMGENPSTYIGADLPIENISWMDAILYANAKSAEAGLTPAYTVEEGSITWNRSANGYRLPTEAEWEYACRAGSTTPFNTETSISTEEANYWGSYPYEIEENYFNTQALETRPGSSQGNTVAVGSYPANGFGLYDMHGNVNEWCWDYYGVYDTARTDDPIGTTFGTRHIYRGGGWNDFAKNLRSAYRAAGQSDMKTFNLGVRLVRNAGEGLTDTITASESIPESSSGGKMLIVYYSWGGNTRGIAGEIQSQTGADIFEITLVHPYSTDYNTVLMEAQEDQHKQARPEIVGHIDNFDDYDVILLGYPNWWASIPMPIATFLEEYDLSGKRVIPFCSHGGGRFGQSLTAIAKLAPKADMGEALAINYSGGASMPQDVSDWLDANGIERK